MEDDGGQTNFNEIILIIGYKMTCERWGSISKWWLKG